MDLGASSARYASGRVDGGRFSFEIVEQIPHSPAEHTSPRRMLWDTDLLFEICRRAVTYASSTFDEATIGVDTWGVDIGLLDEDGSLAQPPVAYRDESHAKAGERIEPLQEKLYELTGIQRQPFNTLCQLIARKEENPALTSAQWLLLPDLFSEMIGGQRGYELTIASTTQMLGLDGQWCEEAFDIAGWPVPGLQPERPGRMIGKAADNVEVIRVAGHDTASAVCGLGKLDESAAFMSVGTWSLLGCILDDPITSLQARQGNFTNERAADGRVRFLVNIPGLYVMNRLKDELAVEGSMADWLARADRSVSERLDLFAEGLFNPQSMAGAVTEQIGRQPERAEEWAGIALMSLAETTAAQLNALEQVTGRKFDSIRAGGGGSASAALCEAIADATGVPMAAGPSEATLLGNIGVQAMAKGVVRDFDELGEMLGRSTELKVYDPRQ